MAQPSERPLSPHLTIWRWGPHMAASIFHRASGFILATAGALLLAGWLMTLAQGAEGYATLIEWLVWWPGQVLLIGITWALFQHFCSGLRHFVMDVGAGYELRTNKIGAELVFLFAIALTAAVWFYIYFVKG